MVEVPHEGNTREEMRIKLAGFFASGVRFAWTLDPPTLTLRVYGAPDRFARLAANDTLDDGVLLPGFSARVGDLFDTSTRRQAASRRPGLPRSHARAADSSSAGRPPSGSTRYAARVTAPNCVCAPAGIPAGPLWLRGL